MKLTRCKLSKKYQCRLLEFFVLKVTPRSAADLLGIQPNAAALFYHKIRQVIAAQLELQAEEIFGGEVELNETYFGGARKGKRGRGAAGKVVVFGLLKRGGKVYTKVIQDTKTNTSMPIIRNKIAPDSIVYTDSYHSYNALDVSKFHHFRINHSTHFAEEKTNHINGIETSGIRRKGCSENTTVYPNKTSIYFSRNASSASILERQNSNSQSLENGAIRSVIYYSLEYFNYY